MTDRAEALAKALDGLLSDSGRDFIKSSLWDNARAALEAYRSQPSGWRPMSSPPPDGTEVLAWREDCGAFIASYTSPDAFPLTQEEIHATDEETLFAKDWFTQWPQAIRLDGSETPTLWQPLPPLPTSPENKHEQEASAIRA